MVHLPLVLLGLPSTLPLHVVEKFLENIVNVHLLLTDYHRSCYGRGLVALPGGGNYKPQLVNLGGNVYQINFDITFNEAEKRFC